MFNLLSGVGLVAYEINNVSSNLLSIPGEQPRISGPHSVFQTAAFLKTDIRCYV